MEKSILRYQISDWHQAVKCKSNYNPNLRISVTDFVQNEYVDGFTVSVEDPQFGTLFSVLVGAYFPVFKSQMGIDFLYFDNRDWIINQLKRFGFYIRWAKERFLSPKQTEILKITNTLGYDKFRLILVHDNVDLQDTSLYATAFKVGDLPMWINPGYSPSYKEWSDAIAQGKAFNVFGIDGAKECTWDWAYNSIFTIDDILKEYKVKPVEDISVGGSNNGKCDSNTDSAICDAVSSGDRIISDDSIIIESNLDE